MAKKLVNVVEEEILNESFISSSSQKLPLLSLNHVSFMCKSVLQSVKFYNDVLGFVSVRRPSSFDFEGAWLFNYGIGIHLLQVDTTTTKTSKIDPKDNHISFQCTDMNFLINKLEDLNIKYVTAMVKEGGVEVNQLFFHDPDSNMIEICNCHVLPVVPISSCPLKKKKKESSFYDLCGEAEALMNENLSIDMMGISLKQFSSVLYEL